MNIRYATEDEVASWNDIVDQNPSGGNILQGKEFIDQKIKAGWTPRYIVSDQCALAVIEKHFPLFGKVWYSPKGPGVDTVEQLSELLDELPSFAKQHGVTTIKIEPELPHDTDMSPIVTKFAAHKTTPVQYNYATVLVDLAPSEDEIMMALNQKGRHAIRRAERDGVTVKQVEPTDENCAVMYDLFVQTASGAGFVIRPASYYREFYKAYGDNGGLFFAYHEGQVVAGAFAMVQGSKSMYKDGASVRERSVYGASHLLQWEVIKWAKSRGSKQHDLAGTPPIDQIKNSEHPFYGLGRFKTSFNKTVTQYVGAYDIPVRPLRAKLWYVILEKLVRKLYFMRRGESWY